MEAEDAGPEVHADCPGLRMTNGSSDVTSQVQSQRPSCHEMGSSKSNGVERWRPEYGVCEGKRRAATWPPPNFTSSTSRVTNAVPCREERTVQNRRWPLVSDCQSPPFVRRGDNRLLVSMQTNGILPHTENGTYAGNEQHNTTHSTAPMDRRHDPGLYPKSHHGKSYFCPKPDTSFPSPCRFGFHPGDGSTRRVVPCGPGSTWKPHILVHSLSERHPVSCLEYPQHGLSKRGLAPTEDHSSRTGHVEYGPPEEQPHMKTSGAPWTQPSQPHPLHKFSSSTCIHQSRGNYAGGYDEVPCILDSREDQQTTALDGSRRGETVLQEGKPCGSDADAPKGPNTSSTIRSHQPLSQIATSEGESQSICWQQDGSAGHLGSENNGFSLTPTADAAVNTSPFFHEGGGENHSSFTATDTSPLIFAKCPHRGKGPDSVAESRLWNSPATLNTFLSFDDSIGPGMLSPSATPSRSCRQPQVCTTILTFPPLSSPAQHSPIVTKAQANPWPLQLANDGANSIQSGEPKKHRTSLLSGKGSGFNKRKKVSGKAPRKQRVRRKCTIDGCTNRVVQGGVCITHGAKRKVCAYPDCEKSVKKAGMCSAHGPARKRCDVPRCNKVSVQGGRCIAHGAKKKLCVKEGCRKQGIMKGMCKRHHDIHFLGGKKSVYYGKKKSKEGKEESNMGQSDENQCVEFAQEHEEKEIGAEHEELSDDHGDLSFLPDLGEPLLDDIGDEGTEYQIGEGGASNTIVIGGEEHVDECSTSLSPIQEVSV